MASEIDQIIRTMEEGNHFLLRGGAGSGKTHTLINLIKTINERSPKSKIACITYTNVAADEINERASSYSMKASTIHDFLWDNIKGFQKNLRDGIISINETISEDDLPEEVEIRYREFQSLKKGIVTHRDVIYLSKYLFETHSLLSKILADKFDYIFVDEYQDTSDEVIKILFENLNNAKYDLRIGLFGDSMQSIYDGIGSINQSKLICEDWQRNITEIEKKLNRRCPQSVIDLANEIRSDGLRQEAEKNGNAPNNNSDGTIKAGDINFLYSSSMNLGVHDVVNSEFCEKWNFETFDEYGKPLSKILLTKNQLIAKHSGFLELFEVYEKDKVIGQSGYTSRIRKYLRDEVSDIEIEELTTFLELLDTLVKCIDDSLDFKRAIQLVKTQIPHFETTLKAINAVDKNYKGLKKVLPTGGMLDFIFENKDLFDVALNTPYINLARTYVNKDKLIGKKKSQNVNSNNRNDEKDPLIKYLYKVQEILSNYLTDNIASVIKAADFKILIGSHKLILKEKMDLLVSKSSSIIGDVLAHAESSGLISFDARTAEYVNSNSYLLECVSRLPYSEIIELYNYTEGLSTYSTQHGVKGDEFDNVLVVISSEKSPQLSICYKSLFEGEVSDEKYYPRTNNLFYVSCTRAKENLIVFHEGECSPKTIAQAEQWFGKKNVKDLG